MSSARALRLSERGLGEPRVSPARYRSAARPSASRRVRQLLRVDIYAVDATGAVTLVWSFRARPSNATTAPWRRLR
jgi:hypothetical protein